MHEVPKSSSALWSHSRQWLHIWGSCTSALHKPMGLKPSSKLSLGLSLCFSRTAKVEEEQEEKQLQSRFAWWLTAGCSLLSSLPDLCFHFKVVKKKRRSKLSSPTDVGFQLLADYYAVSLLLFFYLLLAIPKSTKCQSSCFVALLHGFHHFFADHEHERKGKMNIKRSKVERKKVQSSLKIWNTDDCKWILFITLFPPPCLLCLCSTNYHHITITLKLPPSAQRHPLWLLCVQQ